MTTLRELEAADDKTDAALWEHVLHTLAHRSLIRVPDVKLVRLNSKFHTLCSKRFDRDGTGRRMLYASAFSMLRKVENGWELEAAKQGASGGEVLEMAPAFNARMVYRARLAQQSAISPAKRARPRRG